ncbi:MAG: hypothetical protein PHR06_09100, partial [Candidatus Cloacimonetes bacterium]|nr:hypothetical protein [Candidatus Cloacimonadota bacterium]
MLKQIGRLDADAIYEIENELKEFFELFENGKKLPAEKKLNEMAKTPNYFVREYLGKLLVDYKDSDKLLPIINKMIKHRVYGIRATALFFIANKFHKEPSKILDVLDESYDAIPWEAESIVNELWKNYPVIMKERMSSWLESDDEKKRALAFHGIENISKNDPLFIMDFVAR